MKGCIGCLVVVALICVATATASAQNEARGVSPADNITKFEILPKVSVVDDEGGISITTMTLEYDRAISGTYGFNIELPLARFESGFRSTNGLSDLNVRGRAQFQMGRGWTGIVALESVIPTATDETLGAGKLQVNPAFVAFYPFSRAVFLALITKQYFSVAGDDERAAIR